MVKIRYLFILLILLVSSCSQNNSGMRKNIAELTLSSAGGYLGYQFGDADIFTTVLSSTAGLILGSYLGDYLEQNDYYFYKEEVKKTLNNNELGSSGYWKNIKSGNEGVVIVKSYYKHPECRLIHHIYVVSNKSNNYYDTACRTDGGDWSIIR